MTEFVASNGWKIRLTEKSGAAMIDVYGGSGGMVLNLLAPQLVAVREFFLHERDIELGRWRSKERPTYVAYRTENGVTVVDEFDGDAAWVSHEDTGQSLFDEVAREFFAAHPEPKPWHNAQPGEVWEITTASKEGLTVFGVYGEKGEPADFVTADQTVHLNCDVLAGRRIWPGVSE